MLPKSIRISALLALGSLMIPFAGSLQAQDEDAPKIRISFGDEEAAATETAPAELPTAAPSTEATATEGEPTLSKEEQLFLVYGWYLGSQSNLHLLDMTEMEKRAFIYGLNKAMQAEGLGEGWEQALPPMQQLLASRIQPKMQKYAEEIAAASVQIFEELKTKEGVEKTASGLHYKIESEGTGDFPQDGEIVFANFVSLLVDGSIIDSSSSKGRPGQFVLSDKSIPGLVEGLKLVREGGIIDLWIPSELAFGDKASPNIPANSALLFKLEVLKSLTEEELQAEVAKAQEAAAAAQAAEQAAE